MNWEAVGAIGEVVGALAVVLTIAYLAVQIRQNTRALTSSAEIAGADEAMAGYGAMAQNRELADLLLKGGLDYNSLAPVEKFRYGCHWQGVLIAHQSYFFLNERRELSAEIWGSYSRQFDRLGESPGVRAWWDSAKDVFDPRFREYFEAKLSVATEPPR